MLQLHVSFSKVRRVMLQLGVLFSKVRRARLQLYVSFSKVRRAGLQLPFFKTFGRCAMLQLAVLKTFGRRDVLRDAQAEGVSLYGETFGAYFSDCFVVYCQKGNSSNISSSQAKQEGSKTSALEMSFILER